MCYVPGYQQSNQLLADQRRNERTLVVSDAWLDLVLTGSQMGLPSPLLVF